MDAVVIARFAEDPANVAGFVAEVVARVVGAVDAVLNAAAIRVDQSTKERSRVSSGDRSLPACELDRPPVFQSQPVLWKQTWPVLPICAYDDAPRRSGLTHNAA